MKYLMILLAALGSAPALAASDGYTFGHPSLLHNSTTVEIVNYSDEASLLTEAKRLGVYIDDDTRLSAFSVVESFKCIIHMVNPEKKYKPEVIGHELLHCFYGRWHK